MINYYHSYFWMFQLLMAKGFHEFFLSSCLCSSEMFWNIPVNCKLYLFIPMNSLIHNWYRLLQCIHGYWDMYNSICVFFLWVHYTFMYETRFFKLVIRSIFLSVCMGEPYSTTFLQTISRNYCLIETSKYVIPFPLWWIQVIMELSLSNVLLPLSFNPLFLGFLPNFISS